MLTRTRTLIFVACALLASAATLAADDPVVGTWSLSLTKSKFSPGPAPTSITRVYSEAAGVITMQSKTVGTDDKETTAVSTYTEDGKPGRISGNPDADSLVAHRVDTNNWDFKLMKDGKQVGSSHRSLSSDGRTLTVHNKGKNADGTPYDNTLVLERVQ